MRFASLLVVTVAACIASDDTEPVVHQQASAVKTQMTSDLVDHGGKVLAASKTYAIYWGNAGDFHSCQQQ